MKLTIVKKEKDFVEVEVHGEGLAFVNAIKEELWNDENVVEAATIREHPYLSQPKIWVKVKKGDPIVAIKRAVKRLKEKIEELEKRYEREVKI